MNEIKEIAQRISVLREIEEIGIEEMAQLTGKTCLLYTSRCV